MSLINIVFPNQLFEKVDHFEGKEVVLIEEFLFFKQFNFHKKKLVFHRNSMKNYEDYLIKSGINVEYIETSNKFSDIRQFISNLDNTKTIRIIEPNDDWLSRRIINECSKNSIELEIIDNPSFITSKKSFDSFFRNDKKKFFQTSFYKKQRQELNILIENGKPSGGKWTYDDLNREKYPKDKETPAIDYPEEDNFLSESINYVNNLFSQNPGSLKKFKYPTNFENSKRWFEDFLYQRFDEFGPYEDAVLKNKSVINHSLLSPLINSGILDINYVVNRSLEFYTNNDVRLNSCEGFIRQLIGWREFIRGVYKVVGRKERTKNFWGFNRKIPKSFYDGTTGIDPVDDTIKKINDSAYANHIERLMIIGNFMLLCEFDPDEVYKWFMEMFIDSYDWVMVPNVYGMSQFADGGMMSTKPYISSSNYILKMSDYKKGDWCKIWDSLFWNFMDKQRVFFNKNSRMKMLVNTYDKMNSEKKINMINTASNYLNSL
jgi:deoxyribodipyrimidine photolyase-related protein